MKFFTNKKILFKLIVALCICLTIMNFGMTPVSKAESKVAAIGGTLLNPIIDLLLGLGDAIMNVLQKQIMGIDAAITIDTAQGILVTIFSAVAGILIAALVVAGLAALASLVPVLGPILAAGITSGIVVAVGSVAATTVVYNAISGARLPDVTVLPTYYLTPEEIFKGNILLFDVNVFNPKEVYVDTTLKDSDGNVIAEQDNIKLTEWNSKNSEGEFDNTYRTQGYAVERYYYYKDGNSANNSDDNKILTSVNNSAYELKTVISRWYYTIRNIAIVVLMLVLLYIGIRILLGSVASEKAKYKQMLADWLVAMCLIFLMQYIMVFANTLVEKITMMLSSVSENQEYYDPIIDADDKLIEEVEKQGYGDTIQNDTDIYWRTNLMGNTRLLAQQQDGDTAFIGYGLCFFALVIMTVSFIFTYLKRLLYMMFLTIIAPFVAMTYPLDKINDGQAQAFNMWLKEYIFNLLIQPFHLLLYTILITMAFDLAGTNIIYSLVAIGFMVPAEKFLRNMFGFNKASTPGFLDGAAGAAMTIAGIKSLASFANKGSKGHKDGDNSSNKDNKPKEIDDRGADSGKSAESLYNSLSDESNMENNNSQHENEEEEEQKRKALEQYHNEGFGQNADGQYYNPWTEEYDDEYDPTKDIAYNGMQQETQPEQPQADIHQPEQPQTNRHQQHNRGNQKLKLSKRKYVFARTKNAFKEQFSNIPQNARKGFSTISQVGLGTLGAGIGISAGIASGNAKDVFQDTVAGAFAGSSIGQGASTRLVSGITDGVTETIKAKERRHQEALQEAYGSNYSQHLREKADEEFMKDPETIKMYQREFDLKNKKQAKEMMEKAKEYRKYGVTDNKTIIKAMKLEGNGLSANKADSKRIAIAKLATESKSNKTLDENLKRLQEKPGMKKETIGDIKNYVRQINNL